LFLTGGAIGHMGAKWFVHKIYSSIRIDWRRKKGLQLWRRLCVGTFQRCTSITIRITIIKFYFKLLRVYFLCTISTHPPVFSLSIYFTRTSFHFFSLLSIPTIHIW
jgi:hypothetical protein